MPHLIILAKIRGERENVEKEEKKSISREERILAMKEEIMTKQKK